jgi:hypothetical protein
MEEEIQFIPTEPIPAEPGSPITYEQGERLIKAVEGLKEDISSNHETNTQAIADINVLLNDIKTNTVPTVADPNSNPSGMSLTFEQGQVILDHLNTIEVVGLAVVGTVLVIFVAKQVYKFFAGLIFGGL